MTTRLDSVRCRMCPEMIAWVRTVNGKSMPVDPVENVHGNVIVRFEAGVLVAQVLVRSDVTRPQGIAFMPHWATCQGIAANRGRSSKPPPAPKPVPDPPPSLF